MTKTMKALGVQSEVSGRRSTKSPQPASEVIVTKNGKPVAQIVPYVDKPKSLHRCHEGIGHHYGRSRRTARCRVGSAQGMTRRPGYERAALGCSSEASCGAAAAEQRSTRLFRTASRDVSAVSFWEVAVLSREETLVHWTSRSAQWRSDVLRLGIDEVALDGEIGDRSRASLPDLHDDPADRFIAATALKLGAPLVTSDARPARLERSARLHRCASVASRHGSDRA